MMVRRPIVGRIRRVQPPLEQTKEVCDNGTAIKAKPAPKRAAKGAKKNG
jgi:hypothetical protein